MISNSFYTLSEDEQNRIRELGANGSFSNKVRWGKNHEINVLNGLGAELAFCRLFGAKFDWEQDFHDKGDTKLNGEIVDVKQTTIANGGLVVCPHKIENNVTLYALMVGDFPTFEFRGYARKNEVFTPEHIKNLGYGERYYVPQKELLEGGI